jgi:hypothetical protein
MGVGNVAQATHSAATPQFPAMGTGVGQVGQVRLPCERMWINAYHRIASRFQGSGRNWGVCLLRRRRLRGEGLKAYKAQWPGSGCRDSILSVHRRLDKVKRWGKQVKGSRRARARDRDKATRCSRRHPFRDCNATTLPSHSNIVRTGVLARMASCQHQGGSRGTWSSSMTILHSMYLGTHRSYHRVCQCCYATLAASAAECVQLGSIGMYPLQPITDSCANVSRRHPVVPGEPLVTTPCRRCKRRGRVHHRSMSRYTRVRTCIAEEPCDWPRRSSRVEFEHSERRGRRRSRDVYVTGQPTSRPGIIREKSSQTRLGLGALQRDQHLPREWTGEARVRVSSLSPRRASGYGDAWPPPDVLPMRPTVNADTEHLSDGVWPPPDVIRTHSYRRMERSPVRQSSRIIELSPSPPPARTRSTRVTYRSDSRDRRPRSPHDVIHEYRRSESQVRIASHPRPFRTVIPDRRTDLRGSDETSSNTESTRTRLDSPDHNMPRPAGMDRGTSCRRRSYLHDSERSTRVEVGSPRVQFVSEGEERPSQEIRSRATYADDEPPSDRPDNHIRYRYVERPSSPPTETMQRMNIREASSLPSRKIHDDTRATYERRTSPDSYNIRIRQTSISPHPPRGRMLRRSPSPPPNRQAYPRYRHVSRAEAIESTRLTTPPRQSLRSDRGRARDYDEYELTDSGSEAEGDGSNAGIRSWRGIDERGYPATFVEEVRSTRLLEGGSGRSEFNALSGGRHRVADRSWRDV